MRIPSGVTDQVIYFVAVDATDLKTRETGLTISSVYRSRNGGTATAYTTPTITQVDATNMPGVYKLLLDEDMTIDSGDQSQEVCLHITNAAMAPVTRVFELYRPSVTDGERITVSSGIGQASVQSIANNAITAASINADAITDAKVASDVTIASVTGAVGSVTGNVGGNVTGSVGSVATGGITAASFAADAITAAKVAADVGTEFADALLDRTAGVETGLTFRQAMRLFASVLINKASGLATTTAVYRDFGDSKARVTATVDADGNRSAVTTDAT